MRTVGVEEWVIHVVKAMHENAKSCVHLNSQFSDEFNTKVGVHPGAALHPLLFIIQSWLPMGIALCRRSGVNGRVIRGLEKEAHNLEKSQ